jgi:O-antigen polysaccharide polymerase Wzy
LIPDSHRGGGSYGYSFIAEAYLNFGWAAPIFLFFLGAIYGRLMRWTLNGNDPTKMAIMGIFLSSVLFFARSSLMNVVRPLCWYALIPYFFVILLDSSSSSQRVPPAANN